MNRALQEHEAKEYEQEKGSQKSDEATKAEQNKNLHDRKVVRDAESSDDVKVQVHGGGREGRLIRKTSVYPIDRPAPLLRCCKRFDLLSQLSHSSRK
jgi:hypothetical protein